eukprot:gene20131-biopygen6529
MNSCHEEGVRDWNRSCRSLGARSASGREHPPMSSSENGRFPLAILEEHHPSLNFWREVEVGIGEEDIAKVCKHQAFILDSKLC